MSKKKNALPPEPAKRPALVWLISLFYAVVAPAYALALALTVSGLARMPKAQAAYFREFGAVGVAISCVSLALVVSATVQLFRLRRSALELFIGVFALNAVQTFYNVTFTSWLTVADTASLAGAGMNMLINVAVLFYAYRLDGQKVLR